MVLAFVGVFVAEKALAQPKLKAAATTGMVADLVKQVGAERVEVEHLMGPGVDPHLYKPTSTDAGRLSRADVIFYSGLMLEGRMADLFARLARSGKKVYPIDRECARRPVVGAERIPGPLRSAYLV